MFRSRAMRIPKSERREMILFENYLPSDQDAEIDLNFPQKYRKKLLNLVRKFPELYETQFKDYSNIEFHNNNRESNASSDLDGRRSRMTWKQTFRSACLLVGMTDAGCGRMETQLKTNLSRIVSSFSPKFAYSASS